MPGNSAQRLVLDGAALGVQIAHRGVGGRSTWLRSVSSDFCRRRRLK